MQYTAGLAFAEAGPEAADVAIGWLCDEPGRISLPDESGRRWGIARRIISKHAPHCTAEAYRRLEQQILRHHDPDERRSVRYQAACVENGWRLKPNDIGLAQHALLPSLPPDRMSDTARSKMGVLERKFERPADDFTTRCFGGMRSLIPPIPSDRAAAISDEGWLRLIDEVPSAGDRVPRQALDSCRRGTPAQRRGVAAAAAHNIKDRRLTSGCAELLLDLIDDPDEGVQEALAAFLQDPKGLDTPEVVTVARRFAAGPGFARHPIWLVEALLRREASLVPVADLVFAVSERLTGDLAPATRDPSSRHTHEFHRFVPVVLRLYEQAEQVKDRELRRRCLDWWDRLLDARVWGVREAIGQLDTAT
jgi:hypothetical protein